MAGAARSTDGPPGGPSGGADRIRVAIAGSPRGQLFHELMRRVPGEVEAVALLGADGDRLDITDADAVHRALGELRPAVLINAAAWTAVELAEREAEAARAVNVAGAGALARGAREVGAHLVHVSTDFVFGASDGRPFTTDAVPDPASVYGRTKLDGERLVAELLPEVAIVRTGWVYSSHGSNFVKTMLRLLGERDELGVVADQVGAPTWAASLAEALWRTATRRVVGTLHWSGAGVASWYDLAVAVAEEGRALGLVTSDARIRPVGTADYPTSVVRPSYSVLDAGRAPELLGLERRHWREDLRRMLGELAGRPR